MKKMFLLAVACLMLISCATTSATSDTQKSMIKQSALETFGTDDYEVLVIPSRGSFADTIFVTQSVSSGPSGMAREVAAIIVKGGREETKIVFAGPSSSKAAQVIKDAFSLNSGRSLSHLSILFIGDSKYDQPVRTAVEKSGAKYFFKEAGGY